MIQEQINASIDEINSENSEEDDSEPVTTEKVLAAEEIEVEETIETISETANEITEESETAFSVIDNFNQTTIPDNLPQTIIGKDIANNNDINEENSVIKEQTAIGTKSDSNNQATSQTNTASLIKTANVDIELISLINHEVDMIYDQMKKELKMQNQENNIVVRVAETTTVALSMMALGVAAKSTSLAASCLSILPVWNWFDPITVLATSSKMKKEFEKRKDKGRKLEQGLSSLYGSTS